MWFGKRLQDIEHNTSGQQVANRYAPSVSNATEVCKSNVTCAIWDDRQLLDYDNSFTEPAHILSAGLFLALSDNVIHYQLISIMHIILIY